MSDGNIKQEAANYRAIEKLFGVAQGEDVRMVRHDGNYTIRIGGRVGEGGTVGEAAFDLLMKTHPQGAAGEIVDGLFDLAEDLGINRR